MASGDTKTEAMLNVLGNGGSGDEFRGCCNTKTQSYILDAIDRINSLTPGGGDDFTGATADTDGVHGLVPAPLAGDQDKFLKGDGTWGTAGGGGDTVYSSKQTSTSDYGGAVWVGNKNSSQQEIEDPNTTDSHARYFVALPGDNTILPKDRDIFILGKAYNNNGTEHIAIGDGSIAAAEGVSLGHETEATSSYTVALGTKAKASGTQAVSVGWQTKASSTGGVAIGSQAESGYTGSVAIGMYAWAKSNGSVAIGTGGSDGGIRSTSSTDSIAIGKDAYISNVTDAVAIGSGAQATRQGEFNIGLVNPNHSGDGFNNSDYRLLSGLYDGQAAHDAVTVGQLNGRIMRGAGSPSTSTAAEIGTMYEDTTNAAIWYCEGSDDPSEPTEYYWMQIASTDYVDQLGNTITDTIQNGATSAPTTSTYGQVGTLYSAVVSGVPHVYMCTEYNDVDDEYIWAQIV